MLKDRHWRRIANQLCSVRLMYYDGSKFVAVLGDPKHRRLGHFITVFSGQDPSLFRSLVPTLWFIWGNGHGQTEPPSAKDLVLKGVFHPVRRCPP